MTTADLQRQKAQLDKQIAAETHQQILDNWKQAKAAARAQKEKARGLVRTFKQAESAYNTFMSTKHKGQHEKIQEHLENKPRMDDFPTENEIRAWENKLKDLQAELTGPLYQQGNQLRSAMETARIAAVEADTILVQLMYAENNWRDRVEGSSDSYSSATTVAP